jgi:hypothetical protein
MVSLQTHYWSLTDSIIRLPCTRKKKQKNINNGRGIIIIGGYSPDLYLSQVYVSTVIHILLIASDSYPVVFLPLLSDCPIPLSLLRSRCKTIWLMLEPYVFRFEAPVGVNMTLMAVTVGIYSRGAIFAIIMLCASFQENVSIIKTKPWSLTLELGTIKNRLQHRYLIT